LTCWRAVEVIRDLFTGKLVSHTGPQVYIGQVGGEAEGFFEFYATQVLPRLRED
jgi:hypothetical protein